jgi:hypothetical protein
MQARREISCATYFKPTKTWNCNSSRYPSSPVFISSMRFFPHTTFDAFLTLFICSSVPTSSYPLGRLTTPPRTRYTTCQHHQAIVACSRTSLEPHASSQHQQGLRSRLQGQRSLAQRSVGRAVDRSRFRGSIEAEMDKLDDVPGNS